MLALSHSNRLQQTRAPGRRPRRGAALVFVMVFVIAMAALAMSSIFMASNANLLAKSYDRERDLKYAAEAALSMGKARVSSDPSILTMRTAGQLDTVILANHTIIGADNKPIPGIKVNVWVGPTGSTSGQHGRFSSIVAEARDARGNGFIRRLELTQDSFAKYAYWSNSENNSSGGTIVFGGGYELSLDDTKDFYIHGVMMALGNSFRAENHNTSPNNVNGCNGVNNGRGCIYLSGGIIQNVRGPVGLTSGEGYAKRYSYDRCAVINPPPYFPTTGRFADNRYIELDPAGFDHARYFQSMTPSP